MIILAILVIIFSFWGVRQLEGGFSRRSFSIRPQHRRPGADHLRRFRAERSHPLANAQSAPAIGQLGRVHEDISPASAFSEAVAAPAAPVSCRSSPAAFFRLCCSIACATISVTSCQRSLHSAIGHFKKVWSWRRRREPFRQDQCEARWIWPKHRAARITSQAPKCHSHASRLCRPSALQRGAADAIDASQLAVAHVLRCVTDAPDSAVMPRPDRAACHTRRK